MQFLDNCTKSIQIYKVSNNYSSFLQEFTAKHHESFSDSLLKSWHNKNKNTHCWKYWKEMIPYNVNSVLVKHFKPRTSPGFTGQVATHKPRVLLHWESSFTSSDLWWLLKCFEVWDVSMFIVNMHMKITTTPWILNRKRYDICAQWTDMCSRHSEYKTTDVLFCFNFFFTQTVLNMLSCCSALYMMMLKNSHSQCTNCLKLHCWFARCLNKDKVRFYHE